MGYKNTLVFGDSYSTFRDYIPEGNATYYGADMERPSEEHTQYNVKKVEQTWWHKVLTATDSNLLINDSWSGSTICYRGYNGDDNRAAGRSFICRLRKYKKQSLFKENKVDAVFVFGGTNDCWCGADTGELKFEGVTEEDCYSVLPAFCLFFKELKETLPEADIYAVINCDLKYEIIEGLRGAAEHYGITPIKLEGVDKLNGHPTIRGMEDIANQILAKIKK